MTRALLEVKEIESFYDKSQALFGMSFSVQKGEFCTLIGRNGMGKTTTVKSVMGLLNPAKGQVFFEGKPLERLAPYQVARFGLGLVPEGRQVFTNLTVRENLIATARDGGRSVDAWTLERIYALFPSLERRDKNLGSNLSGGEQQMLAIGRALMTNPRLLILDEATEGLAPLVRKEIWDCLAELKQMGQTVIVIDKNIVSLLRLADNHHIVEKGQVVWTGSSASLKAQPELLERYVGV